MRKTVGILDDVTEYGQRLTRTINIRKHPGLRATFIQSPFEVKEKIADHQIQLLLVSEKYAWQMEDATVQKFILTSEPVHSSDSGPGAVEINRYSQVSDIIDSLLSESSEKENESNEKMIVTFSPDSVDASVELAKVLIGKYSNTGKTLFLPFDNFYGINEKTSITELLYAGLGSKNGVLELLNSFTEADSQPFGGPQYFSDLWQYTKEQMDGLLDILEVAGYQHVIVAAGFMSEAIYTLFKRCDVIYMPDGNTPRYTDFIRQMRAAGDEDIVTKVREYR